MTFPRIDSFLPHALLCSCALFEPAARTTAADDGSGPASAPDSATARYRVIWTADPATRATIAWQQVEGEAARVHFGREDHGRRPGAYESVRSVDRVAEYDGMANCFVRLSGLAPDTRYSFCLRDGRGVSPRFFFDTAPAEPGPFTFVAGGDSRNHRVVRIAANRTVAKLRPLFVAFTGDMINHDVPEEWRRWLDDWQHTFGPDGRIPPIVPHRGNHEKRPETIPSYFDTPADAYFAFSIGGDLFRYYALNSRIPAMGAQKRWLRRELESHAPATTHLVAGYHKPMRPHVSAKSEGINPMRWARLFHRHGMDLALESDSHVMKRTLPLRLDRLGDEGFSAAPDDPDATVFIGEGCWGAPLRAADDAKSWTVATESFNGLDWIRVSPENMRIKTVRVENPARIQAVDPANPFATPEGLELWRAGGNPILEIPAD